MARVGGKGRGGRKEGNAHPPPSFLFLALVSFLARPKPRISSSVIHSNACYGYAGYYLARTLAYKSISILSGARSASGRLFMFSAVKANERARAFALGPRGGGGHSHTLPIRVCAAQRGRDFEAPDLEQGIHFRGVF